MIYLVQMLISLTKHIDLIFTELFNDVYEIK